MGSVGRARQWRLPALLVLAACTSVKDCTTIGCRAGITVHAPAGMVQPSDGRLTVCVDGQCEETAFDDGPGIDVVEVVRPDVAAGAEVTATLELPDGQRFGADAEAEQHRPNGPGCGPVCTEADLELVPIGAS